MAILLNNVRVNLPELNVSVLVPEGYFYVAIEQTGFIYVYEVEPKYDFDKEYWDCSVYAEGYVGTVQFESDEERELCKRKIWKVGK